MKIEGNPKEIAAFVLELQKRQELESKVKRRPLYTAVFNLHGTEEVNHLLNNGWKFNGVTVLGNGLFSYSLTK